MNRLGRYSLATLTYRNHGESTHGFTLDLRSGVYSNGRARRLFSCYLLLPGSVLLALSPDDQLGPYAELERGK